MSAFDDIVEMMRKAAELGGMLPQASPTPGDHLSAATDAERARLKEMEALIAAFCKPWRDAG